MIKERIICNANTGEIIRERVECTTPIVVDHTTEIAERKQRLAETDYVVIKIAEGAATREEYADVIKERVALRERINELQTLAATENNL